MGLFNEPQVMNKPSRSGFDLSQKSAFTAKCGELLPIFHRTVMPGDKFQMSVNHVTRTMPIETAAFTRFTEYFDYFFVPYRLLYRDSPQILTQMTDNPQYALSNTTTSQIRSSLPSISASNLLWKVFFNQGNGISANTLVNFAGLTEAYQTAKLFNFLGYGFCYDAWVTLCMTSNTFPTNTDFKPFTHDISLSLFPLAAYQKIYYDFYRFQRWENNNPTAYNFDYLSGSTDYMLPTVKSFYSDGLFNLRYANFPKDLFFGILPSPQFGDVASVTAINEDGVDIDGASIKQAAVDGHNISSDVFSTQFNILQLRQAQALQRFREIVGTGNQDYKTQLEKLYGVKLPQIANHTCTYLGGFTNPVNIQEVVNSNLSTPQGQSANPYAATLQGKGIGSDNQNQPINFDVQEHGVIMCIYHVIPMVDYELSGFHFDVTKTEVDDFANPVFDKLGYQELPSYVLDATISRVTTNKSDAYFTLGYVPRYYDYKTSLDNIQGAFRSSLPNWLAPVNSSYLRSLFYDNLYINKYFFKVYPQIVDPIFFGQVNNTTTSDQFLVNADLQIKAVRNLDFQGLPY